MNNLRGRLFAPVLRVLERVLPAPVFCGAVYPLAWARALIHRGVNGRPPIAWPAGLGGLPTRRALALPRLPVYLNRTFELLPDRLAGPKWRGHRRFIGLDPVKRLVDAGRPVILGFAHFGPIGSLRNWLRATGVPVAIFVRGKAHTRSVMKRRKDRWALFPDVALTFYQDQLAEAIAHLERGGVLAIALDSDNGRQMRMPFGDGWMCQMATGPFRLARGHGAALVPCAIYNEKAWHVAVEFGAPVGNDLLAAGDAQAGADVLSKLLPVWLAHPTEWTPQLASRFSRITPLPTRAERDG